MRAFFAVREFLCLLGILLLSLSPVCAQEEASAQVPTLSGKLDNLLQGRLYSPNYFPIKGSPFLTEDWSMGNLLLLEKDYPQMPVWYDIYLDDLILLNQEGVNLHFIRLNKEHLQYFSLGDRRFVNLEYSVYRDLDLKEGYYEVSFEDKVTLLVKRAVKVLEEDGSLIPYFKRNDQWFLVQDGVVLRLRNKKSILSVVDKAGKSQLKTFIKKQKIRFQHAGDPEWAPLVVYLNTLQPESL